MSTLTGNQVRKKFLDYFVGKNHTLVKSAPLIPQNDPTLFFTNAGMVPFKNLFTGEEKRDYVRATTAQKCMRVSGKHNDLENVGRTARHHTFFEMLGNFSFGDYFKADAIPFAWEFLTEVIKLPKEKLWITIYTDDDEAFEIWNKKVGIKPERIKRLGEKDNFWAMGDTGPCGPCSEIHYEQDIPCSLKNPNCALGACDCDRFLEIWNLVFMQFERHADGKMDKLPKPSIDTGMGLERLTALLQGKNSNYDSDLFTPILTAIQKLVGKKYTASQSEDDVSMRVLADHIRASVFLVADGVLPSNEGRGYVLRRIMRRAIRHGKLLGQTKPFFYKLTEVVVSEMGDAYPEIKSNQDTITKVIHAEEERFLETLENGLRILSEEIACLVGAGSPRPNSTDFRQQISEKPNLPANTGRGNPAPTQNHISGAVAFKLYDTFGFPLDLTELIAAESGLSVDSKGFDECMNEQKDRARAAWKGSGEASVNKIYLELGEVHATNFLGYDTLEAPAKIVALIQNGARVTKVEDGACEIVFDQTPFYGEGGGQAGDKGFATQDKVHVEISDTQKPVPTLFVHKATVKKGPLNIGDTLQLTVTKNVRKATMRHHTATHIMHAALRKILGSHVRQAGSLVNDKILRFDFSHFSAVTPDELRQIENAVNAVILADTQIEKCEMDYDGAIAKGALAFFGDKYGDKVRVVSVGDYSVELCGGTHLNHASEIGLFKIISEGSVAAGVRRIEAVTGEVAFNLVSHESEIIKTLAASLKSGTNELPDKIEKLQARLKEKDKEIEKLKRDLMKGSSTDYLKNSFTVGAVMAVVFHTEDATTARDVAMMIRDKVKSGIVLVTAAMDGKAMIVAAVTSDLAAKFPAGKIIQTLAPLINGRGGGKPDLAQAGGDNVGGLENIAARLKDTLSA